MKLTIAIATALSFHEAAHGFVIPSGRLTISSTSSSTSTRGNTCGLNMKADEARGMSSSMPMDRKNMLQSAVLAFGAALATSTVDPSEASAAAVDYGKVRVHDQVVPLCKSKLKNAT